MTKMFRKTIRPTLLAMLLLFNLSSVANSQNISVEVRFSEHLDKNMVRISTVDKRQIVREWEIVGIVVPDIEHYSVPSLITEIMKRGIVDASPQGFDGRIVLEVDELFIRNFPLVGIRSFNTRMRGTVKHFDHEGKLVTEREIWSALLPQNYALNTRVGPIVRKFTAEALEIVFPDYETPEPAFL